MGCRATRLAVGFVLGLTVGQAGSGAASAEPEPEPGGVLEEGLLIEDRYFLSYEWGFGGSRLEDQLDVVFEGSGLGTTLRVGTGVDRWGLFGVIGAQPLRTPLYSGLLLMMAGLEGRWVVLGEEVEGPRAWVSGGVGLAWTGSCEETSGCEGDRAITEYWGAMTSGGVGGGWYFLEGALGIYAEMRRERYRLENEVVERRLVGGSWVFSLGFTSEYSWLD